MRVRNVGWLLGGSVVVYLAVACAAAKNDSGGTKQAGKDAGGVLDALVDAVGLGDDGPVGDVEAGPSGGATTTDIVSCDKSYAVPGGKVWFAERLFPGRTKEDLMRGSALACITSAPAVEGYPCHQEPLSVRDGAVAVGCNDRSQFSAVTIAMPPTP